MSGNALVAASTAPHLSLGWLHELMQALMTLSASYGGSSALSLVRPEVTARWALTAARRTQVA